MTKKEKEYIKRYGNIPEDSLLRLDYLLHTMNLSRSKASVIDRMREIQKIKWKSLSYVIYVVPEGTPRPRKGKGNVFYVKGAAANRKLFQSFIEHEDIHIIETPIKFYCDAYLPIPSTMSNVEKVLAELRFIRPQAKPDWDNIGKGYCDMIQSFLIEDDMQVIEGTVRKFYSIKPRLEVKISYMEDFDSVYNKRKNYRKAGKT